MNVKVIIVGAGPVGLLLGNLLGSKRVPTLIFEKEEHRNPWSKAIGITPPSLKILKQISLDQYFLENGIKGNGAHFHDTRKFLGSIHIQDNRLDYPFILSISQANTERILEDNLSKYSCVKLLRGHEVTKIEKIMNIKEEIGPEIPQNQEMSTSVNNCIRVTGINNTKSTNFEYTTEILCGCDGEKSTVRKFAEIAFVGNFYKPTFIMGDYNDKSNFGNDAFLWFTEKGSVESFPLPGKIRRWIVQTDHFIKNPRRRYLEQIISQRTRLNIDPNDQISQNSFGVQHFLAKTYSKDKIFLCGDSAHTMSPIGGQGMNTGFADAEFLAFIISAYLADSSINLTYLAAKYEKYRLIAAKSAMFRADVGMRVGTATGIIMSCVRSLFIAIVMHIIPKRILLPFFMMTNIPYNRLSRALEKDNFLLDAKHQ